jgi:hypothetical protein
LQCSVDDAIFMDAMNVGSSYSHAHANEEIVEEKEYDVDEEGEGLIGARHTGRSANYTIAEDKLLCKTWQLEWIQLSAPIKLGRPIG